MIEVGTILESKYFIDEGNFSGDVRKRLFQVCNIQNSDRYIIKMIGSTSYSRLVISGLDSLLNDFKIEL